jgi:ubiquinone/menaquinone biosynthesis C-methylase UbiE
LSEPVRKRLTQLRAFFDRAAPDWAERSFDLERARDHLIEAGLTAGQAVVDLGAGTGHFLPVIRRIIGCCGRLTALDLSQEMLDRCDATTSHATLICGSVEDLPLQPDSFDAALCIGLLPHFADRARALAEIHRVIRPGGCLTVLHMIGREHLNRLHQHIGGAVAHDLLPCEAEMRASLEAVGFRVDRVADEPEFYLTVARRAC